MPQPDDARKATIDRLKSELEKYARDRNWEFFSVTLKLLLAAVQAPAP